MQGVTPVIFADGFDPLGLVVFKIFGCQATAVLRRKFSNSFSNFAAVKSLPFAQSNSAQGLGCRFELKQITHLRRTPPRQKRTGKAWQSAKLCRSGFPFLLDNRRNQVASFGNFNGGLHQIGKRQLAKSLA